MAILLEKTQTCIASRVRSSQLLGDWFPDYVELRNLSLDGKWCLRDESSIRVSFNAPISYPFHVKMASANGHQVAARGTLASDWSRAM